MTVQNNIQKLKENTEKVLNHCMCANFKEDDSSFTVIFPIGHFPEAVRCSKFVTGGKAEALNKIHDKMEQIWKDSFI